MRCLFYLKVIIFTCGTPGGWCLALFTTAKCFNAMLVIITRFASIITMHYLNIVIISRTAPILVSVLVLDQYQHFLIVSESIKYVI